MSDRFSQAQLLIAALFAVVLTGEMPMEAPLSIEAQVTPLEQTFSEVFSNKGKIRTKLVRCVTELQFVDSAKARTICTWLCRTPVMPSAICRIADSLMDEYRVQPMEMMNSTTGRFEKRLARGVAPAITRQYGVELPFVQECWKNPAELDKAWFAIRSALQRFGKERVA